MASGENFGEDFVNEQLYFQLDFYPRPVLAFRYCRCLHLCVCVSLCVNHLLVLHDYSGPVQTRITKFGPEVQNTLVTIPLTLTLKVKFNLNFENLWFYHYLEIHNHQRAMST